MEGTTKRTHQTASTLTDEVFAGGGEMGALMRSIDWSATPLGAVEYWPQSLRTAVSICLASYFPMLIWWGVGHKADIEHSQPSFDRWRSLSF